jgi:glutaredoxin
MSEESKDKLEECSVEGFQRAFQEYPKSVVVYTQPGCPHCEAIMGIIKEVGTKTQVAVGEIDISDDKCRNLAKEHEVEMTPAVFIVESGRIKERIRIQGNTLAQIEAVLLDKLK